MYGFEKLLHQSQKSCNLQPKIKPFQVRNAGFWSYLGSIPNKVFTLIPVFSSPATQVLSPTTFGQHLAILQWHSVSPPRIAVGVSVPLIRQKVDKFMLQMYY